MANFSHAENHADALRVARMFQAVHSCSRPVIARVQGDAYGGGVGLAFSARCAESFCWSSWIVFSYDPRSE